jgi:hypothetical protein
MNLLHLTPKHHVIRAETATSVKNSLMQRLTRSSVIHMWNALDESLDQASNRNLRVADISRCGRSHRGIVTCWRKRRKTGSVPVQRERQTGRRWVGLRLFLWEFPALSLAVSDLPALFRPAPGLRDFTSLPRVRTSPIRSVARGLLSVLRAAPHIALLRQKCLERKTFRGII